MAIDDLVVAALIALLVAMIVVAPYLSVAILRHGSDAALESYGKYRGSGPAKSFVCPSCLNRSYAPSHIARRWCVRCEQSFPEEYISANKIKTWTP